MVENGYTFVPGLLVTTYELVTFNFLKRVPFLPHLVESGTNSLIMHSDMTPYFTRCIIKRWFGGFDFLLFDHIDTVLVRFFVRLITFIDGS